jgi:hypothetical protein
LPVAGIFFCSEPILPISKIEPLIAPSARLAREFIMLHATEVIGAQAFDSLGNYVGRIKEIFVEPADQPNRIARMLISRGQFRPLIARYDQIASVAPGRISLTADEAHSNSTFPMKRGWLSAKTCSTSKSSTPTGAKSCA